MAYFFLLPILSARESIYLAAPYFIPDKQLQSALVEKAKSGVDVRLMLPGSHTDNWITRASAQARYQELLEAGAKIYEYQPTFMHAKYGVIDGKWSIIGSPNLNSRSRQLDEENAIGIYDAAFGATLNATFDQGPRAREARRPRRNGAAGIRCRSSSRRYRGSWTSSRSHHYLSWSPPLPLN